MSNLTQFYQSGQGALNTVRAYTSSGTYTFVPPPGVTRVMALVFGAGGSGANLTDRSTNQAASGGCGGGFAQGLLSVTPGTSYTITVGAGGVAQTANNSTGASGGSSSFSTLLTATGGAGGTVANTGASGSTVSGGSGSASGAAVLWSFTANGGTQYNPSTTGTNAAYTQGGGGSASGSPYGDGAIGNVVSYYSYGSGGSGWGPLGVSGNGKTAFVYNNPFGISYASGGGGLRNSGPGYASGGGGAFTASNWGTNNTSFNTVNGWNVTTYSYNAGGGANGHGPLTWVLPYQPTQVANAAIPNQFITPPPSSSYTANLFDIVNTTLSGSGGYGVAYNLQTYGEVGLYSAGNGEAGGGGGGLYLLGTGGAANRSHALPGNGGIGGGGGGTVVANYQSDYFTSGIGGVGGFGGGGGGALNIQNSLANLNIFGGAGGTGGGGGAAMPGNSVSVSLFRSGPGGDGAVLIFWRAT